MYDELAVNAAERLLRSSDPSLPPKVWDTAAWHWGTYRNDLPAIAEPSLNARAQIAVLAARGQREALLELLERRIDEPLDGLLLTASAVAGAWMAEDLVAFAATHRQHRPHYPLLARTASPLPLLQLFADQAV
ncbi:MAG: hypothetical protein AAFV29_21215, partial [Myxococcota bacterium]